MHTLLGAPALVVDLLDSSCGPSLAVDLSRAIRLDSGQLAALATGFVDGPSRRAAWEEIRLGTGLVERLDTVVAAAGEVAGPLPPPPAATLPRTGPAGCPGPAELVTLVRDEVLSWTWRRVGDVRVQTETAAVAAVCDAVVAGLEREQLSAGAYERLRRCWLRTGDLPPVDPGDLGPQHELLHRLLDRTAAAGVVQLCQLDAAMVDLQRSGGGPAWARALESAGLAATMTGRVRLAAVASLELAARWPVAELGVRRLLHAAVPAATGAVAALVCADLLDSATTRRLLSVWESVLGPVAGPGYAR